MEVYGLRITQARVCKAAEGYRCINRNLYDTTWLLQCVKLGIGKYILEVILFDGCVYALSRNSGCFLGFLNPGSWTLAVTLDGFFLSAFTRLLSE